MVSSASSVVFDLTNAYRQGYSILLGLAYDHAVVKAHRRGSVQGSILPQLDPRF